MPKAGLPAALRANIVVARNRRRQSGVSRGLQLLQMTHRQLEDVSLLQLADVLALGLRIIIALVRFVDSFRASFMKYAS